MSEIKIGDSVSVIGMNTLHIVTNVVGRTNQVNLKCTVTGKTLDYVDTSAVTIIPDLKLDSEQSHDPERFKLGDLVVSTVSISSASNKVYAVAAHRDKNKYDLLPTTGSKKALLTNISHDSLKLYVKSDKIGLGSSVIITGFAQEKFTVVSIYPIDHDGIITEVYADLLQLQSDMQQPSVLRIDKIALAALTHTK